MIGRPRWILHGDGKHVEFGSIVAPEERLSWPRTAGIGAQHVLAMFGSTFLVPLLTGFSPATTLLFSGVGTCIFLVLTRNRLPSYLGSSFAFIAPVLAAAASGGKALALGGIVTAGVLFAVLGCVVLAVGAGWIDRLIPPVVTGAIVALIGLNLAPAAKVNFEKQPVTALIALISMLSCIVLFRGLLGRLAVLVGVTVAYIAAGLQGQLKFAEVVKARWFGWPEFTTPHFSARAVALFAPVVLVLVAENVGHVKAVAAITDRPMDELLGWAFLGDGLATALAGAGGGSGTTTYAENIGVMATTRVYSTAAYWFAGATAIVLGLCPKFGAVIETIPPGVLGGATVVLYGLIGVLGARIWVEAKVDFKDPVNLMTAAVALVVGVADFSMTFKGLSFTGIALGSVAAVSVYHIMRYARMVRDGYMGKRITTVDVAENVPDAAHAE